MNMKRLRPAAAIAATLAALASCSLDLDYDKYAIVYGVSEYPAPYTPLASTDDDAEDMEDLLTGQGFDVVLRVTTTTVNEAHSTQLFNDFATAAAGAGLGVDDLFLFYFSGHGTQLPAGISEATPGTDGYDEAIVTVDAALNNLVFITDDQLAALLQPIPTARKVVILDACYSGGFISNPLDADAIPPNYSDGPKGLFASVADAIYLYSNFQDYGSDISPGEALVIAASGEQDLAYESGGNGVMTRYLLESASEADMNFDGYITVSESYFYIYRMINKHFNAVAGPGTDPFFPHVSGGPVDYLLFVK